MIHFLAYFGSLSDLLLFLSNFFWSWSYFLISFSSFFWAFSCFSFWALACFSICFFSWAFLSSSYLFSFSRRALILVWKVAGPNINWPWFMSRSKHMQVVITFTASSKSWRNIVAVTQVSTPVVIKGPTIESSSYSSINFIMKTRVKQLPTTIETFPRKMNPLAIRFDKMNLVPCLRLSRNDRQAEVINPSPVTA